MSFADCCFAVKKGREGTGRVVVSKELGIHNSYTLEATFCGADFGPLKDVHFNTAHLCESGRALIDTLLDYFLPNPQQREKVGVGWGLGVGEGWGGLGGASQKTN